MQDAGTEGPRSEMTCRSPFRSGPGWFLGMNVSITARSASESQNRSAIAASVLRTAALNHKTKTLVTFWFGPRSGFNIIPLIRKSIFLTFG